MNREEAQPSIQPQTAPLSLINLDRARQRFGMQKVDLLIELAYTGDVLADAVIKELEALGTGHKLNQGISQGLKTLVNPSPALQAFLTQTEHLPSWVEQERLKRGSEASLAIGNVWTLLSLGPGSLTHTYSSPTIARVLVKTGNLEKMALRRLIETGVWSIESVLPGGLLQGSGGYIHNLQVRLLHARVRTTLLKRGWNIQAMGTPINQVEMARTWLDFTYVPFDALQRFGITFSPDEISDLYHFWQYIAYLLGIDERLYHDIRDQQQAKELLMLIDSTMESASNDSKVLTQAMLETVANLLHQTTRLSVPLAFEVASAITRRLHGDALADQLGVKRTWVSLAMPLITLANYAQRAWDRRSPVARQHAIQRTIKVFQQNLAALEGQTAYQRNASDPTQQQLPQTEGSQSG